MFYIQVAVGYYPFDEQNCKLKFGSWMYNGNQLDIINRFDYVDISSYIGSILIYYNEKYTIILINI